MTFNAAEIIEELKKRIESSIDQGPTISEVGYVVSVGDGVAQIYGLRNVEYNEVVHFESGSEGLAINLESSSTSVIILRGENTIKQGDRVVRTKKTLQAPTGKNLLGRVVDALGNPIDNKGDIIPDEYRPIENPAPGIIARKSVHEPLYTGIKAIDALLPIGKGQRELIIGDRQTGKTAIAIDSIISQKITHEDNLHQPVYCVYVAIGQKCSTVAHIAKKLEEHGAMKYTTIVSSTASEPATLQFLAPYLGCAIAEFFRDRGMHALIIYDDLSKHAVAYRQMSLLLKRPPGREAYPGDVFYIHSRLLERSAKLSDELGSGSLTALPIVETQAGDISAYIPTNIISITDGQIFLEESLFNNGIRPAINIGLSVSRVGSAAQVKAMKQVSGKLKLELAQYRDMKNFASFGSEVNEDTRRILEYGARLTETLKQDQYSPQTLTSQVITLYAGVNHYTAKIAQAQIQEFEKQLIQYIEKQASDIIDSILDRQEITKEIENRLKIVLHKFTEYFLKN